MLATIGQAFVSAGEELKAAQEDDVDEALDNEFQVYAQSQGFIWDSEGMTAREQRDLYGMQIDAAGGYHAYEVS